MCWYQFRESNACIWSSIFNRYAHPRAKPSSEMKASLLFLLNMRSFPRMTCSMKFSESVGIMKWKSFKWAQFSPSKAPSKFFTKIRRKSEASCSYFRSNLTDISNILQASNVSPFMPSSLATSSNFTSSIILGMNLIRFELSLKHAFNIMRTIPKAFPMVVINCLNLSKKVWFD